MTWLSFWRSRQRRAVLLAALGVLAACAAGSLPKAVPPNGVLAPGVGESAAGPSGPFRVVFAAPEGEATEVSEIAIVFDRSLRALDRADAPPPQFSIAPPLAGAFHWVGARAVVFRPAAGELPGATEFVVEVPRTLRALDGSELGAPYRLRFTTPRPALVRSQPSNGETGIAPRAAIELELNQAIDVKALERGVKLGARGKPVAFSAAPARPDTPKRYVLKPRTPLPEDSDISLVLGADLIGREGPLPSGRATTVTFRTYGPLEVERVDCNREQPGAPCRPGSGVGVAFSNPVRHGDARRALRITPELPLRWPGWEDESSLTTYLDIPAQFRAGERYAVRIAKGLKDSYGHALARDFEASVQMGDHFPRVAIGLSSGTLVPAERGPIPFAAVNVPKPSVIAAALERADIARWAREEVTLSELIHARPGARRVALPASGGRNTIVRGTIEPASLLGASGTGVLGLAAEYDLDARDDGPPEREKLAKLGDLGISAKLSRHGSLVRVTRLSTAAPVPGAEVELWQAKRAPQRYVADAQGTAWIPASDFAPDFARDAATQKAVLFAGFGAGREWTYELVRDVIPPWSLPVSVDLGGELGSDGLLFSDRGVYRPGDSVKLKGIVRRHTAQGSIIPKGDKLVLALRSPDDEPVRSVELRVSDYGTFSTEVRLPPAGRLGTYLLSATLGKDVIRHAVRVEEYRPLEFRVDASAPGSVVRGDAIDFEVRGEYLFGAPMTSAQVSASVLRSPASFAPPDSDGFSTDASAYYADGVHAGFDAGRAGDAKGELDANGRFALRQPSSLPNPRGAFRLTLDAEVTDLARQSVSDSASTLVHPGEFYLGIEQPKTSFLNAKTRFEPKLAAIAPDGRRVPGVAVRLELVERRWSVSYEERGGPYPEPVSKVVDRVAGRCELVTRATPSGCALSPAASGYYVVVARALDRRKNPIEAAIGLYALGAGEAAFRAPEPGRVELVLDKPHYRVGERARVLVKSPFPESEAFVTVERAGVYRRERHAFRGSMPTFEVPVTEQYRPNAFVSVELFQKLGPGAKRSPSGPYLLGYAEIRLDPEEQRLDVEVAPSARELRPGSELAVDVRVKDRAGKPRDAEVALYAVDEGVLLLTGYEVPDPLLVLTAPRPLQVATLETRVGLARIQRGDLTALLLGSKGAEGGGGGEAGARRDFRQTAYFNPSLLTERGAARARFRLPDALTTYRVMAVVVGKGDGFGFGTSSVTTSKRLMARPVLPRFVRAGDRVEAGVVVNAKRFGPVEVTVRAEASGLVLDGPAVRSLRLDEDGASEVRFGFRAERAGEARLGFRVEGGGERDAVEVSRRVREPAVLEASALYGSTDARSAEALGALGGMRTDTGGLELSLASTALVGLDTAIADLTHYPYGCTEQLASRLLPLVALEHLEPAAGEGNARGAAIASTLREIVGRQRGDGGFGLFSESSASHAWTTAYSLWTLNQAKRRGAEVPAVVLSRGRDYLRRFLERDTSEPVLAATAAFALDVLAELGAPDAGYMNRLFERRGALPVFAKSLLMSAFVASRSRAGQAQTLRRELEAQIRVAGAEAALVENVGDAYAVLMDSPVRSAAMVLRALLAENPRHSLGAPLARALLAARRGGSFRTTQEAAFALLALDAYAAAAEADAPKFEARVRFGDRELARVPFRGRSRRAEVRTVPMQDLVRAAGARLEFEKEGSGTLFYQARLAYARAALPASGLDAGLFVEKSLRAIEPDALGKALPASSGPSATSFRAGDLVLGELVVTNPEPREYVVIDDPLPAGFETIDTSFETTSTRYALPADTEDCGEGCEGARDARARGRAFRAVESRRELRDDRVLFYVDHLPPGLYRYRYLARATTFGRFVLPPTRVAPMYAPEVFGRTAATTIEVR